MFFTPLARLNQGWAKNVRLAVNQCGEIESLSTDCAPQENDKKLTGPIIPGMPNVHSHAFQMLMAGRAEWRRNDQDSFWSWREVMYEYAGRIDPEHQFDIARYLYARMLEAGYTQVCEFHYLHHDQAGNAYRPATLMADAIIEAAKDVGIGLTLLPALYVTAGFGQPNLNQFQKRFAHDLDTFYALLEALHAGYGADITLGIAAHSLRAVPMSQLRELLLFHSQWNPQAPFHMHISEQQEEVEQCLEHSGQRPIAWVFNELDLPKHTCLIHATHLDQHEYRMLAQHHAVAGLCPTTEANLGDGLFPLKEFIEHNGSFCIGSDSHISLSPAEELRWLEYGQRLRYKKRNVCLSDTMSDNIPHCGEYLWMQATDSGAVASGHHKKGLEQGARADFLVLNGETTDIYDETPEQILDALVFANPGPAIEQVFVKGQLLVDQGKHRLSSVVDGRFNRLSKELLVSPSRGISI